MEKGNDEEAKALEGVLRPLIDAVTPKTIKEPKTKIAQLLRKLIRERLGDAMYASIIDKFLIHSAEMDPEKTTTQLIELNGEIEELLFEIGALKEKEGGG